MNRDIRPQLIQSLMAIWDLAPEMRFGQLVATMSFVAEDKSDSSIWDIEDAELLAVFEKHRAQLASRTPGPIEVQSADGR